MADVRPGSTSAARSVAGPSSSSASSSRAAGSLTARVHGSRTHHGTCNAPSTVLKTAACTGRRALSSAFAERNSSRLRGYASAVSDGGVPFELERAITENELVLHYQPRVLISTLDLRGVEALVRWRHPVRGIVSPAEFVPAAERGGLMHGLDAWVIRESLLQAAVWRRDGLRIGMSVNVTPSLLHDEPFLRLVERTLNIQGDPTTLTFEVAAAALAGTDPPLAGLARLRERGVRLALDGVTTAAGL